MNRAADVTRRVVVPLAEIQERVPRSPSGDPAFEGLSTYCTGCGGLVISPDTVDNHKECSAVGGKIVGSKSVLDVFTPEQVVAIVNRWLYQAEYQQIVHRKRAEEQRKQQKPVKEAFKRLFPGTSFINATDEQITAAVKAAAEREV